MADFQRGAMIAIKRRSLPRAGGWQRAVEFFKQRLRYRSISSSIFHLLRPLLLEARQRFAVHQPLQALAQGLAAVMQAGLDRAHWHFQDIGDVLER